MNEKKDEFKEWVVSTFDKEAEQELRRLQEKEEKFEVPEGTKEAVFARLQEQLKERNERNASRQNVEENQTAEENQSVEETDDIISRLSPEDREALELGRKMLKAAIGANENDHKKIRHRKKPMKIYMALAAVIICVLAMGITSIGGPERVVRMVRQAVGDRDVEYSMTGKAVKNVENEDEEESYQKVEDTFGTEVVKLTWKPNQMKFNYLELDEDNQVAEFYYNDNGSTMVYFINMSYSENSWGVDIEDKVYKEYEKNIKNCEFSIKEYTIEGNKKSKYTAKFRYKNTEYFLIATMNSKDFEKILNNLIFPK